jgi:hypothetical protein
MQALKCLLQLLKIFPDINYPAMTNINIISKFCAWLTPAMLVLLFLTPISLWGQVSGTGSQGGGFSRGGNFENFSVAGAPAPVARNITGGNFSTDIGFLFATPVNLVPLLSLNLQSAAPERGSVDGEGLFASGTLVTATAVPAKGYRFVSWKEGDIIVSTQKEFSFVLSRNRSLSAFFAPEIFAITLESTPANNLGGGTTGAGNYSFGTRVTVNALPNAFFAFGGWMDENDSLVSNQASYSFTVTENRHLTARFDGESYAIEINPSGNGTVTGSGSYYRNEIVYAEATAPAGWFFLRWMEGDIQVSVKNPYLFSATSNRTLVAEFAEMWWSEKSERSLITANVAPSLTGLVLGQGYYDNGSTVTLTASPNQGITFVKWMDGDLDIKDENGELTGLQYTFTATGSRNLTAVFSGDILTVNALANPTEGGNTNVSSNGEFFAGDFAQVSATANDGYTFVNWQDAGSGIQLSVNPAFGFTVTKNRNLTATYNAMPKYNLALKSHPANAGIVEGEGAFFAGRNAEINAHPAKGYVFLYWASEDELISDESTTGIFMPASDLTLTAFFAVETFTLTFNISDGSEAITDAVVTLNGIEMDAETYTFSGLEAGNYAYLIKKAGFEDVTGTVDLQEDKTLDVTMNLKEVKKSIYLLGDATAAGWDNTKALEMEHTGNGVFELVTEIINGPFIKFISVLGKWTPQWGTDAAGTSKSGNLVYQASSSDPQVEIAIPAPVPGIYRIQADTINLTYNIIPLKNAIYLLGDATTAGWDNTKALKMEPKGNGIFEIVTDVIQGSHVKFISVLGQWAPQWGTDASGTNESGKLVYRASLSDSDPQAIPAPSPGRYRIQADTMNLTYTITPLKNAIYLLGDATTAGWDNTKALKMEPKGNGVFEIVTDLIEGPHLKFISVLGQWAPQWGTDASGKSDSGKLVYRASLSDSDPQVIPAPAPGQYRIQADTINLTYTITPLNTRVNSISRTEILIFPNPATYEFNIASGKQIQQVVIADITGRIVFNEIIRSNQAKISLNGFNPGVYMVRIYSENTVRVEKLVVEK